VFHEQKSQAQVFFIQGTSTPKRSPWSSKYGLLVRCDVPAPTFLGPTPTRKSTIFSISTLPRQHAFRVEKTEGPTCSETTTENEAQVSISISFRSDSAIVLRALPLCIPWGCFKTISNLHGRFDGCEWSTRWIFLSGADNDGDPRPAHRFAPASQSSLSLTQFHRMKIAQRTTLSNQLRLCQIPKYSRCRGRLQRHVCFLPSCPFPS
jgi:hypothetical protein